MHDFGMVLEQPPSHLQIRQDRLHKLIDFLHLLIRISGLREANYRLQPWSLNSKLKKILVTAIAALFVFLTYCTTCTLWTNPSSVCSALWWYPEKIFLNKCLTSPALTCAPTALGFKKEKQIIIGQHKMIAIATIIMCKSRRY